MLQHTPLLNLRFFNTSEPDIDVSKNSIFIGISVGVKPMSETLARAYIEWAVNRAEGKVKILIADEIARFNHMVFSHSTAPGALSRSLRDGDKYIAFFANALQNMPHEFNERTEIIRWRDICGTRFQEVYEYVQYEFENNLEFRKELIYFINKYTERRKSLSETKKLELCQYLLHELPTLLDGIHHAGTNHNLILYPTYVHSGMSELVADIQGRRRYPNLARKIKSPRQTKMVEALITDLEISVDEVAPEITATYRSFHLA